MAAAITPPDEAERLAALHALDIDAPALKPLFAAVVENVLRVCQVPFAQITFVDGEQALVRAALGTPGNSYARADSPCAHTILDDELLVIEDAQSAPQLADNPFVLGPPHVRFYGGAPVLAGLLRKNVGSLCIFDIVPRQLTAHQVKYLQVSAAMVSAALLAASHPQHLPALIASCRYSAMLVSAQAGLPVLAVNEAFEQAYGFGTAQATGQPLNYFLDLSQALAGCAVINQGICSGLPAQARLPCRKADGNTLSSTVLLYPLPGADGRPAYYALLLLPSYVHGYERFFLSLEEQDREFMLGLHVDGFWSLDANLRMSELSDYPRKAAEPAGLVPRLGVPLWDCVPDIDFDKADWPRLKADLQARRAVRDFQFCRNTGDAEHWLSISCYPCYSADKVFTGYRGTVRNITDQVLSKRVQQQQQSLLKTCLDNMQPGVVVLYDQVVVYCNTSAVRLLGYPSDAAMQGLPLAQWIAPEDLEFARQRLTQIHADGVSVPPTWLKLTTQAGEVIQSTVSLSSIVWNGRAHLLGTITRISDGGMMEVEIRATQERYERLLVSESETHQTHIARELHDSLGSHLAGISMMLADIRVRHKAEPALVEDLSLALSHVQTASEVTRGLARGLMPVDTTPGSFWRALERLCLDTQQIRGIECEFEVDGNFDTTPTLTANHLYRIAQEAITNAMRHGHASLLRVKLEEKRDYCLMTVEDNGEGFDPEQRHADALPGVGLRSMRARAKMIHGYMGFSSSEWGGTCINVYWPKHTVDDVAVTMPAPLT